MLLRLQIVPAQRCQGRNMEICISNIRKRNSLDSSFHDVYLYNTHDNLSVELYDCITDTNLPYCRCLFEPITLQRDQTTWYCDHDGIPHTFLSLFSKNVSVSKVLHEWSSSIEKADEYARYKKQRKYNEAVDSDEKYLCECINPQSFGKHCEYILPMGIER